MPNNQLEALIDQFGNVLNPENVNNVAPIFHKPIDQHLGIEVSGRFKTGDDTANGQMAYITVARNPFQFNAHDGFGLAWRKQPQFLIDLHNAQQTGQSASSESKQIFNDQYGHLFPLNTFSNAWEEWGAQVSSGVRPTLPNDKQLMKYNVYLIDEDILQEDVYVSPESMWDQTGGKNQFLQAAKMWITPDRWYEYKYKIYDKLAFECWIYDSDNPPDDPLNVAKRLLNRGQTYPPYVAKARYWGAKDDVTFMEGLAGGHFGIGVGNTYNNEWYFDNLEIKSFIETFPMHLFKMSLPENSFPRSGPLTIKYFGVGYDPEAFIRDENSGHSFTRAWVYNLSTNQWDSLGSHFKEIDDARALQKIEKSLEPASRYIDSNGFAYILAHAANSGPKPGLIYNIETGVYEKARSYNPDTGQYEIVTKDFSEDVNHQLRSYYVSVNNANLEGVHRGNTIDVYGFDPDNIVKGVSEVTMTSDILFTSMIPGFPGYVVEVLEIRQKLSGTVLDPLTYTIVNGKKGWAYAGGGQKQSNLKIQFLDEDLAGLKLEIVYLYWTQGESIQTFLTSDTYRAPGADIITKAMPCWCISLSNLVYASGPPVQQMREALSTYINKTVEATLDRSDIINFMYTQGATYVNTDFIITIQKYNTDFIKTVETISQTITIGVDEIARFYTRPSKLIDVIQQGTGALNTSTTTTNTGSSGTSEDVTSGGTSY